MNHHPELSLTSKIVKAFLTSNLSILFIILSFLVGVIALWVTPREEEPQITVPMADVFIQMPGLQPDEVESLAGAKLEKLLLEIDGVENVYLMAKPGLGIITVQFYVGEDRERSLVKLYNKIQSNLDIMPADVSGWVVKPIEVDDVPIVTVTFASEKYSDHDLRRIAEEVQFSIQEIPAVGRSYIIGGRPRQIRVALNIEQMTAYHISPLQIARAIQGANTSAPLGHQIFDQKIVMVEAGEYLKSASDLDNLVIGVSKGQPIYLKNVAQIIDGPAEVTTYTWNGFGPAREASFRDRPAGELTSSVTLGIAKKKGTNAVTAAEEIIHMGNKMRSTVIPDGIDVLVTRNYGETADEKVNELVKHLLIAVLTIVVLLAVTLGVREALIVALAVPMTLAFTLIGDTLVGYTINRVTLFALILSLGLLVDDPIVDVENIFRHFQLRKHPPLKATLIAVDEVRPPTILATFTVIISFLPMFFVTGMMGPYMRPMPFNVPLAMLMSLVVAFTVTPWATYHMLKKEAEKDHHPTESKENKVHRYYSKTMKTLLKSQRRAVFFIGFIILSLLFSVSLVFIGKVPMKMLPFSNKDELQIVIDTPESTPLEETEKITREIAKYVSTINEVKNFQVYIGTASPFDFNGMVRHYFLRQGTNVADIRINLVNKKERTSKTHDIALRIRDDLTNIARQHGALIKIVEPPPGPPVLATVVAEIYGQPWVTTDELEQATIGVKKIFEETEGLADIDSYLEEDQERYVIEIDREKAMLHGISASEIVQVLNMAGMGFVPGSIHKTGERNPLDIVIRLGIADRSEIKRYSQIDVVSSSGDLIPVSELVRTKKMSVPKTIYHKNGSRVQYITADAVGISPYIPIFEMQNKVKKSTALENFTVEWRGEGEWKITLDVFRDLGLAFLGALAGIYILLLIQTHSLTIPLVIMSAIPLTMIGVLPGFWLLNMLFSSPVGRYENPIFFTATGMIGIIALAGIVVRNSIILIDFIQKSHQQGNSLLESIIQAGSIRFRPIVLTAGAAIFGSWVIALDPIFSGLAWTFIFGIFSSTAFTLIVVPVLYWLLYKNQSENPKCVSLETEA